MPNLREIWNFKPENHLHWRMLNSSIANFLQYCYSAILNIELHCSKYCKKIIIFYLTLSPLSLISHLCLSIAEPSTRNPAPQSTANPTPYHAIEHGENQHDNPQPMIHNRSSVSTSLSWSEWNFGFYWSRVVKFRIFCLWVLLIDAFLVDLFSFGCLSWWIIVGLFHHLAINEARVKITDGRELKMRERREMGEKI